VVGFAIMTDMMVKILGQIRDELKTTRAELSSRLDETNDRLTRLDRRQLETEVRLATELVAVSSAISDLKKVMVDDRKLRAQVSDHETRLKNLERRKVSG
jgi:septal ring factor EnvC (AmiA/AmiB activator)